MSNSAKAMVAMMAVGLAATVFADHPLKVWKGYDFDSWASAFQHMKDVKVTEAGLTAVVTGRDSQFYAPVDLPITNAFFYLGFKIRVPKDRGGMAQVYWELDDGKPMSEEKSRRFPLKRDGEWHTYKIKKGWPVGRTLKRLRLDFPADFFDDVPVEIAGAAIMQSTVSKSVDSAKTLGVKFDLKMDPGVQYCSIGWISDKRGEGVYYFTPAPDGEKHTYFFTPGHTILERTSIWDGNIYNLEVTKQKEALKIENFAFVESVPSTPADPVMTSALPGEAIPRAGRPFPLEVVVRNYGTQPTEDVEFSFENLPQGVKVLDSAALKPRTVIPGTDGVESVGPNRDMVDGLVNEKRFIIALSDLGVGEKEFTLVMKAKGVEPRRIKVNAEVMPSLGLKPLAYPPEPKKVDTGDCEVGAFIFPGWVGHQWHGVWSRSAWRKPVLGWYDETNPETIDWQIKHMAENGISFVFVDWYWSCGHETGAGHNHWMRAFKEAKYRKYLKYALNWCNHFDPKLHSVEDMEKVTKWWIENYFNDPQYLYRDGKPVVIIFSPHVMERGKDRHGGCRALLEISQKIAKEAGYKGIYFIAQRGDAETREYHQKFVDEGFSHTCTYRYLGSIPGVPVDGDGESRPFKWVADTSLSHWRALQLNSPIPFMPSLSTGWDNRPWCGEIGWEVTNTNTSDFRRICFDAKKFADESGNKFILMGPLDEWGEGEIGYPNHELGFGMFEAVRDAFGRKPPEGWPVNYAPEDVGLKCPQRN